MADQQEVITWSAVGFAVLSWAPKLMGWIGNAIEGNRSVKVKENESFKDFLKEEFINLKVEIAQLRKDLDDCQSKHAEAERRVIATEAKLDLLNAQHNQLLKQDKETSQLAKGMAVALKADPELIKPQPDIN